LSLVGYVVLPASASGYEPVTSAISPDGTRVYVLTYAIADYIDGPPAFKPRVYVFDSSTAVTSPPQSLPVVGYFEFNDYPSCRVFGCFSVRGNITADGGALLFVGNRNFVVVPTTATLTPVSSAPPGGLQTIPWKPSR
jgi:DNA-binding beta-propeller fold protein YncE